MMNMISHLHEMKVITTSCSEQLCLKSYTTESSRLIFFFVTFGHEHDQQLYSYGIVHGSGATLQLKPALSNLHLHDNSPLLSRRLCCLRAPSLFPFCITMSSMSDGLKRQAEYRPFDGTTESYITWSEHAWDVHHSLTRELIAVSGTLALEPPRHVWTSWLLKPV